MLTQLLALALYAGATVAAVRWLLLAGLDMLATRMHLSSKAKGQLLGYATSVPELVVVVSAAWAGVFEAGFWNVASSNIINWMVFLAAVAFYRQHLDLTRRAFIDELAFGVLSVAIPIVLQRSHVVLGLPIAFALFGLFAVYKVADRMMNRKSDSTEGGEAGPAGSLALCLACLAAGIVVIGVCGNLLGKAAGELVQEIGVPAWLVGWILGFVTSVPEMSSFFAVFAGHKRRGTLHLAHDTQETLDALIASNMGNLGIILPIGVVVLDLL